MNQNIYHYIYKLTQHSTMGYQIQNYPFPLTTALICNPQSIGLFQSALSIALANNCDALITPIFSDNYLQNVEGMPDLDHCFILSDEHLKKSQIGIIFPYINQCVWKLPFPRRKSILTLIMGYSSYLNLKYFSFKLTEEDYFPILQTLQDPDISKELTKCVSNLILIVETSGDNDQQGKADDKIWKNYINFRQKLEEQKFPLYIELALEIKPNAPLNRIINRWKSEKIVFAILSCGCFTQNAKGFAILPAKHERILLQLLILRANFTYKVDKSNNAEEENHKDVQQYYKYVLYSMRKHTQNKLTSEKQALALQDYLQNPLQPYADNLQSATYQVFENDEQKYDEYQTALQYALQNYSKDKRIVIYYIGSGRGALLYNAFQAARKTQRKIFVYTIEKNVYPIQTLKKRIKENKWEKFTKIVYTDIRDYEMPEHPDIFLSELLGGFGDNELSPQCLYWAQKNIAPDTICIPKDYSSFIRPVSYQNIHRKIPKNARQIYYTVYFGNYYTSFQSQEVWKFTHPIRAPKRENEQSKQEEGKQIQNQQQIFNRYSRNVFIAKQDIVINGFAGYFNSNLHGHAQLSILPEKPTFGMYSWFPLFFSFQNAEFLHKGEQIMIEIWRKGGQKKVWYEWKYKVGEKQSIVHNKDGSSVAIQL